EEIDLEGPAPHALRGVENVRLGVDAGIVDQDVHGRKARAQRLDAGAAGDVDLRARRRMAAPAKLLRLRPGPGLVEIGDDDGGAVGGKAPGDCQADTLGGAGDERGPAGESSVFRHGVSSLRYMRVTVLVTR